MKKRRMELDAEMLAVDPEEIEILRTLDCDHERRRSNDILPPGTLECCDCGAILTPVQLRAARQRKPSKLCPKCYAVDSLKRARDGLDADIDYAKAFGALEGALEVLAFNRLELCAAHRRP